MTALEPQLLRFPTRGASAHCTQLQRAQSSRHGDGAASRNGWDRDGMGEWGNGGMGMDAHCAQLQRAQGWGRQQEWLGQGWGWGYGGMGMDAHRLQGMALVGIPTGLGVIPADATLPLEQAQEEELVLVVALKQEAFPGRAKLEELLWAPLTVPVLRGQSTWHPNMAMCLCLLINHSN